MSLLRSVSQRAAQGAALALLSMLSAAGQGAPGSSLDDLTPATPTAFLPGGMLGIQIGGSWEQSKHNPALRRLRCQDIDNDAKDFDQVCFFHTSAASRVAGAEIHDGFIVRKGDRVVLIGTGISIKNADDPVAESVVRSFQTQVHAAFQHVRDEVLWVNMPARHLSAQELAGYSQHAPVLLVQLEHKASELAVLYGYLAPVNVFGALTAD